MLENYIKQFLNYCQASNFSAKSIDALASRLNEFNQYCQATSLESVSNVNYQHLLAFVADFEAPSVHVKKNRVWVLHHFYHFLKLNQIIDENIAAYIPYPKIGRKVPQYLTPTEFNQLLEHFASRANSPHGLRNLIVIMLFGFLGLNSTLKTSTLPPALSGYRKKAASNAGFPSLEFSLKRGPAI